jgi:Domain of unknown function (DUF4145)
MKDDQMERAVVLRCMGCNDSVVVVERMVSQQANAGPAVCEGIHWWPLPGSVELNPDIPTQVGTNYAEGIRALSVKAPRAAAVMFRAMLAEFVMDKGTPAAQAKRTLYDRLEQMHQDGSLHPSLVEWVK